MRFLILDTYARPILAHFAQNHPETRSLTYTAELKLLLGQLYGTADFYAKNLRLLGHPAQDIIVNYEALQKKWGRENNIYFWQNILERQILDYKPDILYCQNLFSPGNAFLHKIKKNVKAFIVGQVASPMEFNHNLLTSYDLILTSFPHFVDRFKNLGIKSEYFRIAFEETVLQSLKKGKKEYGAIFVGGFSKHHHGQWVMDTATDIWGYGLQIKTSPKYHGEAWGIDMYNLLYNSRISLNRHIDVAENYANNMRLFESTGVGAMLITDYKDNLPELFKIGTEIETYRTKKELVEKVNYYLAHNKERAQIAKSGQKRTLKEHTYIKRMTELLKILSKYL
ncbi:MAG: hypothetical protein A3J46_01845 [Candidatus Yanofskybacteria bacterium RIFCSPHIGHO2_02_FULL_41_11]|uniref:Spore protein YkvP/CgeB glycosyl transferase-like domain-containing protein n=1 Tax=Candidatus Yanofskybacteria bacterium RIFCSPHIGHO2_02_FULL_41_11 TaxID=1802675 RepID=A0A1F8F8A4_9BACT|nr:MAG: Radical SAM domain protein [Microgenomates group bacterium GW2011_GWA1_48_10]OGN08489.1 MAG: hypothetical protein A3J46_01845 [Candidatus Yanofskybacteria bacterium RIFCSPHIGHO2_02_FULL_41_11]